MMPILNVHQLKFGTGFQGITTSVGEVMRASIPSNLILQSETIITLNNENEVDNKN